MILLACAAFLIAGASAHESSSPHYSNLSLSGAQQAAPSAAPAAPKPKARTKTTPTPTTPVAPALTPSAPAPATAPATPEGGSARWPLAAGLLLAVAAVAGYRRRRREREALALAAHELKSPLAAIESYLDLINTEASAQGPQARQWLEDIARTRSTAAHLRRTIGDILDMTKVEDGTLKLALAALDPAEAVRECMESYRPLAEQGGLKLICEAPEGLPRALADKDRVRQILDNLVSNALKHSPTGGPVLVRARAAQGRVLISVLDQGPGVPTAQRHRLFGKFARLAPARDGSEGTGLGLYLSRLLARAQGGSLDYRPREDGPGSEFTLTLPGEGA